MCVMHVGNKTPAWSG